MSTDLNYLGPRRTGLRVSPPSKTEKTLLNLTPEQEAELSPLVKDRIIDAALEYYLHIDPQSRKAIIADINAHGHFRVFGYGSLIRNPAYPLDQQYRGQLDGWECGPFCKDRFLRGRPGNLGITLGALPAQKPGSALQGMVQEIWVNLEPGSTGLENIVKAIRNFSVRETSLNPIYRYEAVDVTTLDVTTKEKRTVKALICRADDDGALFLGRNRTAPIGPQLTLLEKAAVIAMAHGVPSVSVRETGLDYWRFVLHCRYKEGIPPEPHIRELVETANALRALMPASERAALERIERRGLLLNKKEKYDPRVFRRNPRLGQLAPRDVKKLYESARRKMGLLEPLPPGELAHTHQLFRELHR